MATTTTLTASPSPVAAGQPITFTATVISTSGIATPTGTVDLMHGSTTIGTGTLDGHGQATIKAGLPPGAYAITAVYAGDTSFQTSASTALPVTVNKIAPTITWAIPADMTFGTPLGSGQLDATASVPGAFTYTPAAGSVLPEGQGQVLSVVFTPSDTIDYTTATGSTTINVATPTPPHPLGTPTANHSGKGLTAISIAFNEALEPSSASNVGMYSILGGVRKKGKTVYTRGIGIKSVMYNPSSISVTISLAKPNKGAVQVTVHGGLTATNGATSRSNVPLVVK
jgi:hypothetical protein